MRHTHRGTDWDIPLSLLEIQRRWDAADAECSRHAAAGDTAAYDAAKTRRLEITLKIYRHPWLIEAMARGKRFQADQAMKDLARAADRA